MHKGDITFQISRHTKRSFGVVAISIGKNHQRKVGMGKEGDEGEYG